MSLFHQADVLAARMTGWLVLMENNRSVMSGYRQRAFGLEIFSALPLPELLASTGDGEPDIEIVYGAVPDELPGALTRGVRFQAAADQLVLQVDGVARFWVMGGRRVVIDRDGAADDDDVRVFLLSSAMGALLHQRGDLVLHGSAVEWGDGCVAFMGFSGVGKSTLAAAFRGKGHAVLADDLCVVRPGPDGRMLAYPSFPQAKLWPDSLKQTGLSSEGLRRIRRKLEKRAVPLGDSFATAPLRVKKTYLLRSSVRDGLTTVPVQGVGKFNILRKHTYRFGFLAGGEGRARHFQQAIKLARQAPLTILTRPDGSFMLDELVALVEADLRE